VVGASRIRIRHLAEQGRKSAQALERIRARTDRFFPATTLLSAAALAAGLGEDKIYTLDEIGQKFGVTRERIRQIEKGALEKISKSGLGEMLKGYL